MSEKEFSTLLGIHVEALQDDLVPAVLGADSESFKLSYRVRMDFKSVLFTWTWDRLGDEARVVEFALENGDYDALLSEIKAYFFDLCVMLANL